MVKGPLCRYDRNKMHNLDFEKTRVEVNYYLIGNEEASKESNSPRHSHRRPPHHWHSRCAYSTHHIEHAPIVGGVDKKSTVIVEASPAKYPNGKDRMVVPAIFW
jgi:hypothetical protein